VKELFLALCLAIALEGMIYALFPNAMRRAIKLMLEMPEAQIRIAGLVAASLAIGVIWVIR